MNKKMISRIQEMGLDPNRPISRHVLLQLEGNRNVNPSPASAAAAAAAAAEEEVVVVSSDSLTSEEVVKEASISSVLVEEKTVELVQSAETVSLEKEEKVVNHKVEEAKQEVPKKPTNALKELKSPAPPQKSKDSKKKKKEVS